MWGIKFISLLCFLVFLKSFSAKIITDTAIRWSKSKYRDGKWHWKEGYIKIPEIILSRRSSSFVTYLFNHPHPKKKVFFKKYYRQKSTTKTTIILIAGGPGQSGDIWHTDIVDDRFTKILGNIDDTSIVTLDHRGIDASDGDRDLHLRSADSTAMAARDIIYLAEELKRDGSSKIFIMGTSYGAYVVEGVLRVLDGGGGDIIDGAVIDSPSQRRQRFNDLEDKEEVFWRALLEEYPNLSGKSVLNSYNSLNNPSTTNGCKKVFKKKYGTIIDKTCFITSALKKGIQEENGSLIELVIAFIIWMDNCPNIGFFVRNIMEPLEKINGGLRMMEGMLRRPEYLEKSLNKHIICSELIDVHRNLELPLTCRKRAHDLFGQCSMYSSYYQMSNGQAKYDWRNEWELVSESLYRRYPLRTIPKLYLYGKLDIITPPPLQNSNTSSDEMVLSFSFYGHNLLPEGPCLREAFEWLVTGRQRYYVKTIECILRANSKSFIKWEVLPYLLKRL